MNCPTTRYSTPAAAPRTGWGEGAPRGTQSKTSIPFAALPHELRKDPRLKGNRTAIVLAAALLEYARARDSCWPSNRRLAEDLGCCHQTIRNALAALQAAGWVRVEHGASNPTGRIIWLTWRAKQATPPNRLDPPLKPAGGIPLKPVEPEAKIVVVEEQEESPKFACERLRREIPPTPVPTLVTGSPAPEAPPAPPALPSRPEPQFSEPALSSTTTADTGPPGLRGPPQAQHRSLRAGPGSRQLPPYSERHRPGPQPSQSLDPPRRPRRSCL